MKSRFLLPVLVMAICAMVVAAMVMLIPPRMGAPSNEDIPLGDQEAIADMLSKIDEAEIHDTVFALQDLASRHYGELGNAKASEYLYGRLSNIDGLTVEYQGGDIRNVIATLPGSNSSSSTICMVGAHYDSVNDADPAHAPGATDNGGGVAIVLELARVMSQHTFENTIQFALWNAEDGGADARGSEVYAQQAADNELDILLYLNFDSSCYDPDGHLVLDVMSDQRSQWVSDMMVQHNSLYAIGFTLTLNAHDCWSDHRAFWDQGYPAVMTHQEDHDPAHTSRDTIDKVSTLYAKKNGQLGLSVLARLAQLS
ncbi:MAG: M20/M25/M40 family metallo-hydrolase [Methanomassiliicoccus sp.]|nr:M20/M25/M40 family metallo-hydrolase [Methanomassiliicoccus sp.]